MNNELIERMMTSREVEVGEATRDSTVKPVVYIRHQTLCAVHSATDGARVICSLRLRTDHLGEVRAGKTASKGGGDIAIEALPQSINSHQVTYMNSSSPPSSSCSHYDHNS